MLEHMFHLSLPILEKIIRPIIVFLVLIFFLRLFGKRELAQLNPFDLVVLLSLSNTVQNAIIGDDNSVTGGIIGAFSLLSVNWVLSRVIFHAPRLNNALQGSSTTLVENGTVDQAAMNREKLTHEELMSVLHKQSVDSLEQVRKCVLEPNGTFYIEQMTPSSEDQSAQQLQTLIESLTYEVAQLRAEIRNRPALS